MHSACRKRAILKKIQDRSFQPIEWKEFSTKAKGKIEF